MDNTTTPIAQKADCPKTKTIRTAVLIGMLGISTGNAVHAQNKSLQGHRYINYGLSMGVSGAGYGTLFMQSIGIQKYRKSFTASICMQRRTMQVKGLEAGFQYELVNNGNTDFNTSGNGRQQLNAFACVRYMNRAPLGKGMANAENMQNPTRDIDWNTILLSTVEGAVGVEFNIKIHNRLIWKNNIGLATYYRTAYPVPMYFGRTNISLMLGTGIMLAGI